MNRLVSPRNTARSIRIASLLACAAVIVGCQSWSPTETWTTAPEPEINVAYEGEAATQPVREYDQTVSLYQSGDIPTDSTAFRYRSKDGVHPALVPIVEPAVFIGNLVTSPVTAWQERDGIVSTGPQFAPTYTAMPPLPASQAQVQEMQPTAPSTQPVEATITTTDETHVVTTSTGLTPAAELSTTAFAIVGHVQWPGRYESADGLTLAQALVAAGLVEKNGEKVSVKIERAGEEPSSALLSDVLTGNTANPVLQAGDVITVTVTP